MTFVNVMKLLRNYEGYVKLKLIYLTNTSYAMLKSMVYVGRHRKNLWSSFPSGLGSSVSGNTIA